MSHLASLRFYILLFLLVNNSAFIQEVNCGQPEKDAAFFVFGDSIYDPGNNNYLNVSEKANYWPYGESFFSFPTGRFSDGRLIPDFIDIDRNLPLGVPYLQPGVKNLTYGANFAASGACALVENNPGAINLWLQLGYFEDVANSLIQDLGDAEAEMMLKKAVYVSSIGGNDYYLFIGNYPNATTSEKRDYVKMVIGNMTEVVKRIYKIGGRKFAFQNVGPMGCLPIAKQNTGLFDKCEEEPLVMARLHNDVLPKAIEELESQLSGFKYSIFDYYTTLYDRIKDPFKYGFKEANIACCGYGSNRGSSCGVEPYELCRHPGDYVFFDGAHPTEHAYSQLAKLFWEGVPPNSSTTGSYYYSLKQLFELDSDIADTSYERLMHSLM